MAKEIMLQVRDVEKTFNMGKVEVKAVRGISFDVSKGDFVFVVGPSGSGKTTLMDMIGTLSTPSKGKIFLDGKDTSKLDKYGTAMLRREKIGFVFQTFNLVSNLTCVENVLLPIIPTGKETEYKEKARNLLDLMGLSHRHNHTPNEISGGEKQRVTIARAMINDPVLVLADEPTGEIDSVNGNMIMDYMREMNKKFKTTFVIITHDTEFIKPQDKVLILKDGKVQEKKNFTH